MSNNLHRNNDSLYPNPISSDEFLQNKNCNLLNNPNNNLFANQEDLKIKLDENDKLNSTQILRIDNIYCEFNEEIKKITDKNNYATIACRAKNNNPNFLSIIHSNKLFQEVLHIEQADLINKSYDFLFNDIDLSYSSSDQVEYTQLIRAVKDFKECNAIITLLDFRNPQQKIRFKISFFPQFASVTNDKYAIFIFEKIDFIAQHSIGQATKNNSVILLRNLERSLRNERLLREISGLLISDLPIDKIASQVSKILCNNLKIDRCIIHDYQDEKINFAVEFVNSFAQKIINNKLPNNNSQELTNYIAFQNNFYLRFGDKSKKITITIVDDVSNDQNFTDLNSFFAKYSIVNQIAITIVLNEKIIGNIFLHQGDKRTWMDDEIEMLEIVANQLAIAISRFFSMQNVIATNKALLEKSQQLQDALNHEHEMRKMQNEFIALVSHEFKTPLQIIDSTRENVVRKIKNLNINDESINKGLDRIRSGVWRMNGLINTTLNLAKMENSEAKLKVNLTSLNLSKLLEDNIDKSKNLAQGRNIEIISNIANNIPEIKSDPMLIEHIFTNLISNAIKYSPNNSKVKVSAEIIENNNIEIKVQDYGIGIPSNEIDKIGSKFFRASNSIAQAGTGIGIYLTKNFIELLGGKFSLTSKENTATLVKVILPINP
jgi:signal transduction histidine kinase